MPEMNTPSPTQAEAPVSPMMICDRLIGLAQDADRAGYTDTAGRLVILASRIFDEKRTTS
jgi:hypothetical protein